MGRIQSSASKASRSETASKLIKKQTKNYVPSCGGGGMKGLCARLGLLGKPTKHFFY